MAEAGYPNGFETTLSFDLGFAGINEPLCVLTQESLAQIGIKCTINKIPGATWRTELNKKVLPLYTNVFSGWLDYPEYFFIWCYHGKNSIFNTMSYQSKETDAFIEGAVTAAASGDKATYDKDVKGFVNVTITTPIRFGITSNSRLNSSDPMAATFPPGCSKSWRNWRRSTPASPPSV